MFSLCGLRSVVVDGCDVASAMSEPAQKHMYHKWNVSVSLIILYVINFYFCTFHSMHTHSPLPRASRSFVHLELELPRYNHFLSSSIYTCAAVCFCFAVSFSHRYRLGPFLLDCITWIVLANCTLALPVASETVLLYRRIRHVKRSSGIHFCFSCVFPCRSISSNIQRVWWYFVVGAFCHRWWRGFKLGEWFFLRSFDSSSHECH